ncbi:MAG: TolC family protein [Pyrinomonadaceae bacterium]
MRIKLQVINDVRRAMRRSLPSNGNRIVAANAVALVLAAIILTATHARIIAAQGNGSTSTQTPASSTTQQPGSLPTSPAQLPPNSATAPIRPGNEAQQSTQPQTGVDQQRQQTTPDTGSPRPVSPQSQAPAQTTTQTNTPGGLPTTSTPAGTLAPQGTNANGAPTTNNAGTQTGVTTLAPGQNVGASTSSGVAPAVLPQDPPPIAPDYRAPLRPLPSAERVGVDAQNQTPLTLGEAIALALQNNNDIDASRIDVQLAEFNLTTARSVYDPILSSENYFERRTTPTSSTIGGGSNGSVTQTDATGDVRFGGFSPFAGGSYQADFSSTRLTTNNQFVTLNPQFPTAFTLTYTQPILRGRRFDNNRRNIEIAKKNLSLTDAQFRQRAIDVIAQVEQSYWDLVFALRNVQVQIDAVKQARAQLESNGRLVAQGVLAPIDIVAAGTQITTFEQSVYTAQEAVTRAENSLKTLLLPDRTAALWSQAITPITPVSLEAPRVPLGEAVKSALLNRPELAELNTSAEINRIDERFFREQTKPQFDLVGTYTSAGLAGTLVPPSQTSSRGTSPQVLQRINDLSTLAGLQPLPASNSTATTTVSPNLVGGYAQSLTNILEQNFPTARVGVRISLPLRNRAAAANLGRSLAQGRRLGNQKAQQEQLIEADVRNSLQAVRSSEARLASSAAARSSAEQQYASEQRMFRAGTTTVYLVLQRQTELLGARGRELQAQTDLNKAISNFQRATGSTLETNHVAIRTDTPSRQLVQTAAPINTSTTNIVAGNAGAHETSTAASSIEAASSSSEQQQ